MYYSIFNKKAIRYTKLDFVRYLINLPDTLLYDSLLHVIKKANIQMFLIIYNKQIELVKCLIYIYNSL